MNSRFDSQDSNSFVEHFPAVQSMEIVINSNKKFEGSSPKRQTTMVRNRDRVYEKPRMFKKRNGSSHSSISVAAILGQEELHLPIYLDKIRPIAKAYKEERVMTSKYLTKMKPVGKRVELDTKVRVTKDKILRERERDSKNSQEGLQLIVDGGKVKIEI